MAINFVNLLKKIYKKRKANNPSYSLRAFANHIKVPISSLSEILDGKKGISKSRVEKISKLLGLTKEETEYYSNEAESTFGRSKVKREVAKHKALTKQYKIVPNDLYSFMANWENHALFELIDTDDFKSDTTWIANKLKISDNEVLISLDRIKRLGLIKISPKGIITKTHKNISSVDEVSEAAIKEAHKQYINKAELALFNQDPSVREFLTLVLAINDGEIPKAKDKIKKFMNEFNNEFGKNKSKNKVYCFSVNFFEIC